MRSPVSRWRARLLAVLLLAAPAAAQEAPPLGPLTGTLRKVREAGAIALGHREASVPFSFLDARGQPIGYSVDLCREIVDAVAEELGFAQLAITWRAVTPESRIRAVVDGEIDLECGSTTSTAERQRQVAFSPVFFLAGTKLLVPRDSPVRSLRDLAGRTVVATAGTTNEAAIRTLSERQNLGIRLITEPDHAASFAKLAGGGAGAFASDDVLLHGLIATAPGGGGFRVAGPLLSYEPYALMFRRADPAFAALVGRTFERLAQERVLGEIYNRWFTRRLPTGELLGLPMGPQLTELFRMLGAPD